MSIMFSVPHAFISEGWGSNTQNVRGDSLWFYGKDDEFFRLVKFYLKLFSELSWSLG
jgi:hypothetical protein